MTSRNGRNNRRPLRSRQGRPLRSGQGRPIRVRWLAGGPCKSVGMVLVWSSMSRSRRVVEGDGVALGAGHRLLVVAVAGRSGLATLQRLPIDCSLLLTSLMRVGGMRNNSYSRENQKYGGGLEPAGCKGQQHGAQCRHSLPETSPVKLNCKIHQRKLRNVTRKR